MKKPIFLRGCFAAIILFIFFQAVADSGVNLILTRGSDRAVPIAILPFVGIDGPSIAGIIVQDLRFSGEFKVMDTASLPANPTSLDGIDENTWRKTGVDNIVLGNTESRASRINLRFTLANLVKSSDPQVLLQQTYSIPNTQERALAHHIADLIFQQLIGVRGIFSTRIAYIQVSTTKPTHYTLLIADADGFNPQPILNSNEPIMSPAWSPDGKKIAYVSFEGKRARIYIANIATGERKLVSAAPGINGAPAWSADGKNLAIVLSKSGSPKIYLLDLTSGQLKQLTTGDAIDTEPNFAPDGQSIIFTSDRGGSPQIYRLWLGSGKIDRLTFAGDYNARASFSKDGKRIVMINRNQGEYNIAVQNLSDGMVQVLTNSGRDDSPTIAPNGMMVLYGNEFGELGLVSMDGRVKLRVPGKGGKVQDPAWSPFL